MTVRPRVKTKLIALRLSKAEFAKLAWIAEYLNTNISDAVRTLVNSFKGDE